MEPNQNSEMIGILRLTVRSGAFVVYEGPSKAKSNSVLLDTLLRPLEGKAVELCI